LKGYTLLKREFDENLRAILQMDYGLILISHSVDKTFKDEAGNEFNQIVPTLSSVPRTIVSRMCDIIGYSRIVQDANGDSSTKLFLRGTPRYVAGSRFKYTPDFIDFNYNSLVKAISDAIDKQAEEEGSRFFTDTASNLFTESEELDYDSLMADFADTLTSLAERVGEEKMTTELDPKITHIIESHLGKGKKISQCSIDQVEAIDLIVNELKILAKKYM